MLAKYVAGAGTLFASIACAQDNSLPSVQIGNSYYDFSIAAAKRGARVESHGSTGFTVYSKGRSYLVNKSGEGLYEVKMALFPESILVQFEFKKTIESSEVYLNGSGPIKSIAIDEKGNGDGSAYLLPSPEKQTVEVRKKDKSAAGIFTVKEKVSCKGKKQLDCDS